MKINKDAVRKHFNRHAKEYDEYAHIQFAMAERLMEQIRSRCASRSLPVRSILEIGCGTGTLTKRLAEAFPDARITAIDLAEDMLEETARKCAELERRGSLDYIVGDAEAIAAQTSLVSESESAWNQEQSIGEPEGAYDLIVSGAAFQWFNEPRRTVNSYVRLLSDTGALFFSTFCSRTFQEMHHAFQLAEEGLGLPHVPRGQRLEDGDYWRDCFPRGGNACWTWSEEEAAVWYPTVPRFLQSIKRTGASNALSSSGVGAPSCSIGGKKLFREMERFYLNHYSGEKGIRATYHYGFGCYDKGADSV